MDWEIQATNSTLPRQLDYVTTLVSLSRDGNVVAYTYEIDEDELDMSMMIDGQDQMRAGIAAQIATLNSPTSSAQTFMRLLREGGKDLHYIYKGNKTGTVLEIKFTNNELLDLASE